MNPQQQQSDAGPIAVAGASQLNDIQDPTPPRRRIRAGYAVAGLAVVIALAAGVATGAAFFRPAGHDRTTSTSPKEAQALKDTISHYLTAVNDADITTLKALSCGPNKTLLDNPATSTRIADEQKKGIQQHGAATISGYTNLSVDGEQATAIAAIAYGDSRTTQLTQANIFDLSKVSDQWKVCWSAVIR